MKKNKFVFLGLIGSLVFAVVFSTTAAFAQASYATLNGNTTLKVGSRGTDVSSLQNFMSSDRGVYPSGLVTGYFGTLTKAAAIQMQLAYDLSADGIVGANTRNKINNVIALGQGMDISAPVVYNLALNPSTEEATIAFTSNESVKATIFYSVNPISWNEATNSSSSPVISGNTQVDNTFSSSKSITLTNLSNNTRYYYTVMTTDMSGNVSVIWPSTFMTD